MKLKINQVVFSGKIVFVKQVKDIGFIKKVFKFYDNSVYLTRYNFNGHICKNIKYIFLNNPKNLLQREVERLTGEKIKHLEIRISNIQHSVKLEYNKIQLVKHFIKNLSTNFEIDKVEITQEPNVPCKSTLESLLETDNISYIAINLKLIASSVTLKLQLDKTKSFTHGTVIVTNFNKKTVELLKYLEKQ